MRLFVQRRYITIDRQCRNMLIVNYWDSTIRVFEIDPATQKVVAQRYVYDPKGGQQMKASADKHVNHSINDASAQAERQADPHSHAIVLDPIYTGTRPAEWLSGTRVRTHEP